MQTTKKNKQFVKGNGNINNAGNNNNGDGIQVINNGNNSDLAIKWEMYKALQPGYLKGILSRKQEETYKALSNELGMS